ncbi:hypothetical protein ACLB2K_069346 [Fragaria x ananassa]
MADFSQFQFWWRWGVIRDSHGQFQACFAARQAFISSPLHIELVAMQKGLHLVHALQLQSVSIESDCLMIVQAVNALACDLSSLGVLVHDIRSLVSSIQDYKVVYAPRQANRVAHRLASFSYEDNVTRDWYVYAPEFIQDALMYDMRTH